jgi:hypothetical protein
MKLKNIIITLAGIGFLASCTKDLNRTPRYSTTADVLYSKEAGYRSSLAKIYGGLALTGNQGPAGNGDLGGIDEGFSSYLRNYWNLQELSTDEAVIGWNDKTIKDFHNLSWTSSDEFNRALYSRIFYQITLANAFIAESSDDKVAAHGITGTDAEKVKAYRAEARFLRALSYWHALDLYGSPTFVTEKEAVGAFLPKQATRQELFNYVEQECLALESLLPEPRTNEYGRADKAANWMLLANLYLNANVYTGTPKFTEAVNYSSKVINAGYALHPKYGNLFLADNDQNNTESIFSVNFDGKNTQTYGGTTFLVHAPVGGKMNVNDFGIDFGWGGLRTTKALVDKFTDITGNTDKRAMFFTNGQSVDITDIGDFASGYAVTKWKNITSAGAKGSDLSFVDDDFPMFRLGEAYLIYAEAILRGGTGGSNAQALAYVNKLRERAYGNTSGNLTAINLDNILDERAREMYWEGKRRTDLIRFGKFTTGDYLWPWKGGVAGGRAVEAFRNIYPIPAAEINTNTNLVQNSGY